MTEMNWDNFPEHLRPSKPPENKPHTFVLTEEEFREGNEGGLGYCVACGEEREDYTDPDAERCKCESCGQHQVYGLDNLLIMGHIDITE